MMEKREAIGERRRGRGGDKRGGGDGGEGLRRSWKQMVW